MMVNRPRLTDNCSNEHALSAGKLKMSRVRLDSGEPPGLEPIAVSTDEAARLSGLSKSTFKSLMIAGEIASFKVGSRRLIALDEIKRFIAQRISASGS